MGGAVSKTSIPRLVRRTVMKTLTATHNGIYRASDGRIGARMNGMPVLLLTSKGRKSGKARTTPLLYVRSAEDLVVVASNGGSDYIPAWWLNLRADADAHVELGRRHIPVTARKASPEERARLWPEFVALFSGYAKYEQRTAREIPVVILEPRSS
jgi:deazaflavin-dependent oxidoreductase (nitroreductase family)